MLTGELIIKTIILLLLLWSSGALLVAILQTYDQFNPSYIGHYFRQYLARPAVGFLLALLLWLLQSPLAQWLMT
jgi:O-antigen/teichoic acid export membrane protein